MRRVRRCLLAAGLLIAALLSACTPHEVSSPAAYDQAAWDRASWHKGEAVQRVLRGNPRLQTLFFPPASPDLNPQEHVWSQARAAVSHNHNFIRFDLLVKAFLDHLSKTLFRFDWLDKYAPSTLCQS